MNYANKELTICQYDSGTVSTVYGSNYPIAQNPRTRFFIDYKAKNFKLIFEKKSAWIKDAQENG